MGLLSWFRRERQWRHDHVTAFACATNVASDGLTAFQHQALAAVSHLVTQTQFKRLPSDRGQETYLLAPLGEDGAELYIYPNEAAILGVEPYAWFEEWDYRTPAELLEALVEACACRVK